MQYIPETRRLRIRVIDKESSEAEGEWMWNDRVVIGWVLKIENDEANLLPVVHLFDGVVVYTGKFYGIGTDSDDMLDLNEMDAIEGYDDSLLDKY